MRLNFKSGRHFHQLGLPVCPCSSQTNKRRKILFRSLRHKKADLWINYLENQRNWLKNGHWPRASKGMWREIHQSTVEETSQRGLTAQKGTFNISSLLGWDLHSQIQQLEQPALTELTQILGTEQRCSGSAKSSSLCSSQINDKWSLAIWFTFF